MKKILFLLLCLVSLACLIAMPFLFTHSEMLPEKVTEYYELKAQDQAQTATGADAQLMALLLGGGVPAPVVEEAPAETEEGLSFSVYGLYLLIGAVLGVGLLAAQAKFHPALRPALLWTAGLSLPLGMLGARLVYCLSAIVFFLKDIGNPAAMLKIWEGGLALTGALFSVALAGVIGAKIGKASIGKMLDLLAGPMLIFAFFTAFSLKEIGMGFGPEMDAAIPLLTLQADDISRLNTPLLFMLFVVSLLILHARLLKKGRPQGHAFALTAFLYGSGMILMESLRRDGHMLLGFVHVEMMLDMAIALPALLYLARKAKRIIPALGASVLLSGAVIGLEFALDRASIGDLWLYLVYIAAICAYLWLGCSCAKKAAAV